MQNFISSFYSSTSFQFVNEHLNWEEETPHRQDCHDPPHAARVGFLDDRPSPRRLAAVAMSGPLKATPAQMGFPGDATWRRRLSRVVGSDLWNNSRGKDDLLRNRRGEDCHPEQETVALTAMDLAKLELDGSLFTTESEGYVVSWYASLIEFTVNGHGSMTNSRMSKESARDGVSQNSESPWREEYEFGKA